MTRFHEAAPAVPESVGLLRRAIAEFARSQGADDDVVMAMQLASSEAMSNAVMHAFVDRPAPGTLTVCAVREGDALCVVVRDDGSGMKPRLDSPGLGIGMPLMTGTTQALKFGESPEGGTEVTMRFALADAA
jgi:serine/threonine-protein kinase RsbW